MGRCLLPATPDLPDWPDDWLRDGPPFAIELLGILEEERVLRAAEHECIHRLRAAGLIR